MQLELGLDVIRSYKRLAYTPWHALAEFVDNSTQSYFDNRAVLDAKFQAADEKLSVRIVYDRDNDLLRITDNSMGMGIDELGRAMRLGTPPEHPDGRSQYGLGMKTAACWFGDVWTVRTKKLGSQTELEITVDVERIASGQADLRLNERTGLSESDHYTIIQVSKLHKQFQTRTLGKIATFLKSMYRQDLREGILDLQWRDQVLEWVEDPNRFAPAVDGGRYYKTFHFVVNGKDVSGWIGVLDFGKGGRPEAGFSILRRGRVIKGYPESWRPQSIFGQQEGTNDLINQRITGEIHLDEFAVSHTKDSILWEGDEEEVIEEYLKELSAPYVAFAKSRRKFDGPISLGPSDLEIRAAVSEFQDELDSSEIVDVLRFEDVPPPEVVRQTIQPVLSSTATREPSFSAYIEPIKVHGYLQKDLSPNDPYVAVDTHDPNQVVVVINMSHPFLAEVSGSAGMLNYLRECTFDAIAEWKAMHLKTTVSFDTIKLIKDRLMRVPANIELRNSND